MRAAYKRKALAWYQSKPRGQTSALFAEMFGLEYWATVRYRYRHRQERWDAAEWPLLDDDRKAGPMYSARRRARIKRKAWR